MESRHWQENAGLYGWLGLAAYVVAADVLLPQTLSTASDRMLDGEYGRLARYGWIAIGATVGIWHVYNGADALGLDKYDPIKRLAHWAVGDK